MDSVLSHVKHHSFAYLYVFPQNKRNSSAGGGLYTVYTGSYFCHVGWEWSLRGIVTLVLMAITVCGDCTIATPRYVSRSFSRVVTKRCPVQHMPSAVQAGITLIAEITQGRGRRRRRGQFNSGSPLMRNRDRIFGRKLGQNVLIVSSLLYTVTSTNVLTPP